MRSIVKMTVLANIAMFGAALTGVAQEKLRMIDEGDSRYTYKNPPVSIVNREYKGRSFAKGDQLRGSKEWLSDVTFDVKNNSNKTIVYLYIDLVVDGQGKIPKTTEISVPIVFGNSHAPLDQNSDSDTASFKPGEVMRVSVNQFAMASMKKALSQYAAEDFQRVSVDIRYIHYGDGSGWTMGFETRQDPDDPGKWRVFNPNKRTSTFRFKVEQGQSCNLAILV